MANPARCEHTRKLVVSVDAARIVEECAACGAQRRVHGNVDGAWTPSRAERIATARKALTLAPVPAPIVRGDGLRAEVDTAGYVILTGPGDEGALPSAWLAQARRRRIAVAELEAELNAP